MPIVTGQILKIYNSEHFFFQPENTNEAIYIGHDSDIGELEVGKTFTVNLLPRYTPSYFFKNPKGNYKLIDMRISTGSIKDNNYYLFLYFKIRDNNDIIQISVGDEYNFNNFILGDYFDLELIEDYKGFNVFNNLPENKTSENKEILIIQNFKQKYCLASYDNKIIFLTTKTDLDSFIGKPILVDLYRKYLSSYSGIFIGTNYYSGVNANAQFILTDNTLKLSLVNIENKPYILETQSILNTNNSGKILNLDYFPIKYTEFRNFTPTTDNTGYELLNIQLDASELVLYLFKNTADPNDLFALRFLDPIDLNNRYGSFFNFKPSPYYLLTETTPTTDTTSYLLKQIFSSSNSNYPIYEYTKNGESYYVNGENFDIATSLVGKYFDIGFIPYIAGTIKDVN